VTTHDDHTPSSRGVLLGRSNDEWVWSGAERSTLVIGPTRSGKTSTVIVPNVLSASHAVIATSTKQDVALATSRARSRAGSCLLFDPSGQTEPTPGVELIGWSPLRAATTWDGALGTAQAMVAASQRRAVQSGPVNHWSERAGSMLASLSFAASQGEKEVADLVRWVDRHEGHEALEILEARQGTEHPSTSLLVGLLATDAREQSGIWSTASGVLGAYRSLGALSATRAALLDAHEFVSGANTLYVCAPGRQQGLMAPLIVGLLDDLQQASLQRNESMRPVLFALDELANIAPIPELPQLVSEGGGQGVLTIGCLQDLSQARARWGPVAEGFMSMFSTTLVLGGIADRSTLALLRDLSGHHEPARTTHSVNRDARGRRSEALSTTPERRERLSIDDAARTRPGHALVLDAANRLGWIEQTVAYRDEPWRGLIERTARDLPARER